MFLDVRQGKGSGPEEGQENSECIIVSRKAPFLGRSTNHVIYYLPGIDSGAIASLTRVD